MGDSTFITAFQLQALFFFLHGKSKYSAVSISMAKIERSVQPANEYVRQDKKRRLWPYKFWQMEDTFGWHILMSFTPFLSEDIVDRDLYFEYKTALRSLMLQLAWFPDVAYPSFNKFPAYRLID